MWNNLGQRMSQKYIIVLFPDLYISCLCYLFVYFIEFLAPYTVGVQTQICKKGILALELRLRCKCSITLNCLFWWFSIYTEVESTCLLFLLQVVYSIWMLGLFLSSCSVPDIQLTLLGKRTRLAFWGFYVGVEKQLKVPLSYV